MSTAPTVDVLILSYNTRELLADCLASIRQHKPDPSVAEVRVRVLDNDSSDGSPEMVERSFPEVEVVRSGDNVGTARANNRLAETSDAGYVMLLNSDTRWTEDVVGPLLRTLEESPRAVVVGPRMDWPDGRRQPSAQRFPTPAYELAGAIRGRLWARLLRPFLDVEQVIEHVERPDIDLSQPSETPTMWATCWLMRRSDVEAFGLFDERFFSYDDDIDFARRMSARGRTFVYDPRVRITHIGGGSSTESKKTELTQAGRRLYYRLHHGRLAAFLFAHALPAFRRADALGTRITRRAPRHA
jgi:GT2 family glycosyltransferase